MLKYTHKLADRKRLMKKRGTPKTKVSATHKQGIAAVPETVNPVRPATAPSPMVSTNSSDDTLDCVTSLPCTDHYSNPTTQSPAVTSDILSSVRTDEYLAGTFTPSDYQRLVDDECVLPAIHAIETIPEEDDCVMLESSNGRTKPAMVRETSLDNNCGIGSLFDDSTKELANGRSKPVEMVREASLDNNCGIGSLFDDSAKEPANCRSKPVEMVREASLDNNCGIGSLFEDSTKEPTKGRSKPMEMVREASLDNNCGIGSLFDESAKEPTAVKTTNHLTVPVAQNSLDLASQMEIGELFDFDASLFPATRPVVVEQTSLDLDCDLNALFNEAESVCNYRAPIRANSADSGCGIGSLFDEFSRGFPPVRIIQRRGTPDLGDAMSALFVDANKNPDAPKALLRDSTLDLGCDMKTLFRDRTEKAPARQSTLDLGADMNALFRNQKAAERQTTLDLGNDMNALFQEPRNAAVRQNTLDLGTEMSTLFRDEAQKAPVRQKTLDLGTEMTTLFRDEAQKAPVRQQTLDLGTEMAVLFREERNCPVRQNTLDLGSEINTLFEESQLGNSQPGARRTSLPLRGTRDVGFPHHSEVPSTEAACTLALVESCGSELDCSMGETEWIDLAVPGTSALARIAESYGSELDCSMGEQELTDSEMCGSELDCSMDEQEWTLPEKISLRSHRTPKFDSSANSVSTTVTSDSVSGCSELEADLEKVRETAELARDAADQLLEMARVGRSHAAQLAVELSEADYLADLIKDNLDLAEMPNSIDEEMEEVAYTLDSLCSTVNKLSKKLSASASEAVSKADDAERMVAQLEWERTQAMREARNVRSEDWEGMTDSSLSTSTTSLHTDRRSHVTWRSPIADADTESSGSYSGTDSYDGCTDTDTRSVSRQSRQVQRIRYSSSSEDGCSCCGSTFRLELADSYLSTLSEDSRVSDSYCSCSACDYVPTLPVFAFPKDSLENVTCNRLSGRSTITCRPHRPLQARDSLVSVYDFVTPYITDSDSVQSFDDHLNDHVSTDSDASFDMVVTPAGQPASWGGRGSENRQEMAREISSDSTVSYKNLNRRGDKAIVISDSEESLRSSHFENRKVNATVTRDNSDMLEKFDALQGEIRSVRTLMNRRLDRIGDLFAELARKL